MRRDSRNQLLLGPLSGTRSSTTANGLRNQLNGICFSHSRDRELRVDSLWRVLCTSPLQIYTGYRYWDRGDEIEEPCVLLSIYPRPVYIYHHCAEVMNFMALVAQLPDL